MLSASLWPLLGSWGVCPFSGIACNAVRTAALCVQVRRIRVANCSKHESCVACLGAADPHCGWCHTLHRYFPSSPSPALAWGKVSRGRIRVAPAWTARGLKIALHVPQEFLEMCSGVLVLLHRLAGPLGVTCSGVRGQVCHIREDR